MTDSTKSMTRRGFIAHAGAAGAVLAGPWAAAAGAAGLPPNIVFLLTDDQRWDAMGNMNPMVQTPNMDDLAAKGVRFENAFVTTSICAASRASIFAGVVERTHMYTFRRPPMDARFTDNSYPALLRAAGYRTGFVGKFGVAVQPGATDAMFDVFTPLGRNPYFKKQPDGSLRHLTDITADRAIEFLRSCRSDQPFCLSVSFNAPHAEDSDPRQYIWPEACDHLYEDLTIPVPPTADPAFFEAQPKFLQESLGRVRWKWRFDTPEKFQQMVKGYYRMITGVDAASGRILAALDELGLAGNTVVILSSDNGYFLGDRGFAGKWLPHEPSLRVPLIVYDPRAKRALRGVRRERMALNIDIAPTILDLAGVPIPDLMQGRSLTPILRGRRVDWRRRFFFEHLMEHPQIIKHEGVRTRRYKYARSCPQEPGWEEL
ncbi:MAG: sulfatase, partial [Armatimonadota bacterium]